MDRTAIPRGGAWLVVAALFAFAMLLAPPAEAKKKKRAKLPEVDIALAAYNEGEGSVGIAVKVERTNHVRVRYEGVSEQAARTVGLPHWWQTGFNAVVKDCYQIVVFASNRHGRVRVPVRAGRLGAINACTP